MTKKELAALSDEIVKQVGLIAKDELFRLMWNKVMTGVKDDPGRNIDEDELRRMGEQYAREAIKRLMASDGFLDGFK